MSEIGKLKEDVRNTLENSFINHSQSVKKEMDLLNMLITSFVDESYTYDEYCRCRMQYEVEACDFVDIDFEDETKLTKQEQEIIRNRAVRKHMENQDTTIYEELLKEKWVKWNVEKSVLLDKKIFYPIFRYANIRLLKNKIQGEAWENKKDYFEKICDDKAKSLADIISENNKNIHEQNIRAQNM